MPAAPVRVDSAAAVTEGTGRVYTVDDAEVAVFNVAGTLYAISDQCPHKGASLSTGTLTGDVVACPFHGWRFDLKTGRAVGRPGVAVDCYQAVVADDELLLQKHDAPAAGQNGIQHYLVRYGVMGWVAHFGSLDSIACTRRERVLVNTSRGAEIAEVLAGPCADAGSFSAPNAEQPNGEVVRLLSPDELNEANAAAAQLPKQLDECRQLLAERQIPLEIIDGERLFGGEAVVLYYLGEKTPGIDLLNATFEGIVGAPVIFHSAIDAPEKSDGGGCGSGGCGSGGCGSGGCGSGAH